MQKIVMATSVFTLMMYLPTTTAPTCHPRTEGAAMRTPSELLSTMDARVWAEEFMLTLNTVKPEIDEAFMIAWFANAIMAAHDITHRAMATRLKEVQTQLDKYIRWTPDGTIEQWCDELKAQVEALREVLKTIAEISFGHADKIVCLHTLDYIRK